MTAAVNDTTAMQNTDRELYREANDAYAYSVFVTKDGAIGMNCGGHVIVKTIKGWHHAAAGNTWKYDKERRTLVPRDDGAVNRAASDVPNFRDWPSAALDVINEQQEEIERLRGLCSPDGAGTMPSEEQLARTICNNDLKQDKCPCADDPKRMRVGFCDGRWSNARAVLALLKRYPSSPDSDATVRHALEIMRLRKAIADIQRATVEGRVCDDVAWFDTITTLHDFCDQTLNPSQTSG